MADDNPGHGYVTHAECAKTVTKINGDLKTIKMALVGRDLRAGIVKDVGDMKNTLNEINNWRRQQEMKGRDWVDVAKKFGTGIAIVVFTYVLTTFT